MVDLVFTVYPVFMVCLVVIICLASMGVIAFMVDLFGPDIRVIWPVLFWQVPSYGPHFRSGQNLYRLRNQPSLHIIWVIPFVDCFFSYNMELFIITI